MSENYEQAVIEWAHTYNAYQRIAASPEQLSDQIQELTAAYEREGAIPGWAGVDLLRGWAFYIVRGYRHGGAYDPLLVEYPELAGILDAIRRHPAAERGDLPPSPAVTEVRQVEVNDAGPRSYGHLFVINGDLTKIACDAILIPTDGSFRIEPYWRGVVARDRLPLSWGRRSVIELPVEFRINTTDSDKIAVWLGNIGQVGDDSGFEIFETKIHEFIARAKASCDLDRRSRLYKWTKPRFALPVVGSAKGGGSQRRGDLLTGLVRTLQKLAHQHDVDIILVTASDKAYAAAQRARTGSLVSANLNQYWDLDNRELVEKARVLAESAIERNLVLFLGSGVSAGAGLPTWARLLDGLAAVAGLDEDVRKHLHKKDARDYATLIERRMAERQIRLRDQIATDLAAQRYSLQHGLLASLPSKEAVTTNFDTLFELAATTSKRKLAVLPSDPRDSGGRWLLKMHGSVDDPDRIVITRSDFLDMPRQYGALLGLVQGLLGLLHDQVTVSVTRPDWPVWS